MAWRRPWIKLWVEMLEDPKVVVTLGQAQRWVWIGLLLATTRSPDPGRMLLPNGRPMSARQLRQVTRSDDMSLEEFEETLKSMESLGMVRWEGDVLAIPRWHERQDPETPAQRMKRYRERVRIGNGDPAQSGGVTPFVTERHAQGNPAGTPYQPPVTAPVTQRNAPGPSGVTQAVTERHEPELGPPTVTERNAEAQEAVTGAVTQRHARRGEGVEGGGANAPPQKTRSEEEDPSGANAPSGAAPAFSANSLSPFQEGENPLKALSAAEPTQQDSSPDLDRGGGGTAPRPELNGEDSSPGSAGGGRAAPRAMSVRRKTGGNPQVDQVLESIQELWGQPIVHWAKEAKEVKAALARGYEPQQVVACWKAAQESPRWKGRWMPMAYLVEDLGEFVKNGGGPLRKWGGPPAKEEARAATPSPLPTARDWRTRRGRW
jgi:hypothetical protein